VFDGREAREAKQMGDVHARRLPGNAGVPGTERGKEERREAQAKREEVPRTKSKSTLKQRKRRGAARYLGSRADGLGRQAAAKVRHLG